MMNRQFSALLDLLRVVCAVLIVLSHLGHGHLVGGALWSFTVFGNEARMTFFVLSGFLIAYVTDKGKQTPATYAAARLARLYSVILPAMLLTLLLDAIGQSIHAKSYVDAHSMADGNAVVGYVLSALMLNQSWGISQHFGSDGAYWVIPYEFWYYFMYGSFMLLTGWRRIVFTLLGAAIAGPKILGLLPVWLLGVASYHILKHREPGRIGPVVAVFSLMLLLLMLWIEHSTLGTGTLAGMTPNSPKWEYVIACCVAINIYGISQYSKRFSGFFSLIERPLAWVSSSTMALILFHLPVISVIHSIERNMGESIYTKMALIVSPFLLSLTLGHWCERQKKPLRAMLLRILSPIPSPRSTQAFPLTQAED